MRTRRFHPPPALKRARVSRPEREWWGPVELGAWDDERETRALASSTVECAVVRDDAGRRLTVTLRWYARDLDDALRRVRDAVGIDAQAFRSGYPLPRAPR